MQIWSLANWSGREEGDRLVWKTFVPAERRTGAAGRGTSQGHLQLLTGRIALSAGTDCDPTAVPMSRAWGALLLVCTTSPGLWNVQTQRVHSVLCAKPPLSIQKHWVLNYEYIFQKSSGFTCQGVCSRPQWKPSGMLHCLSNQKKRRKKSCT